MCDAMGYISAVYLPSPSSSSGKCFLVTAIGNSSISDAHTAFAPARSKARGNPPMPSKRLAIVTGRSYWAQIRLARNSQNGSAMELPRALYFGESASLWVFPLLSTQSPISTHPSGNPWSLVQSLFKRGQSSYHACHSTTSSRPFTHSGFPYFLKRM